MAEAKIQVEVGQFGFSGEGEQQWLAQQMDKILKSAESLTKLALPASQDGGKNAGGGKDIATDATLPHFLKEVNASSQVNVFLATAEWLRRKGKSTISTGDVSKALKEAHQNKLANASQCLANNVSNGYCEKDGKGFYVTDQGRKQLGLS